MRNTPAPLEMVSLSVPESALAVWEAALRSACDTVATVVEDEGRRIWRLEAIKPRGEGDGALAAGLAVAALATGLSPAVDRAEVAAEGWLARTSQNFPELRIGRFRVRGTHLPPRRVPGAITVVVDAGVAFGSGEHGSTRGCLRALERVARGRGRRVRRVADVGCGSGILAVAAAKSLRQPAEAVDIDPWAVRVAAANARLNGVAALVRVSAGDGWRAPAFRGRYYELVFANILARPLCRMAPGLAAHLAPGGVAILAGLLHSQGRAVLAAHRRAGLRLLFRIEEAPWTTLILRR